jgi:hypothetical protein
MGHNQQANQVTKTKKGRNKMQPITIKRTKKMENRILRAGDKYNKAMRTFPKTEQEALGVWQLGHNYRLLVTQYKKLTGAKTVAYLGSQNVKKAN